MRATSGRRVRGSVSAAEQDEWLARFEASGQSVRVFCAEHGLIPTTLTWWRRRRREQGRRAGDDGALIEVTRAPRPASRSVSSMSSVRTAAVIALPVGPRVEIAAGSDPSWVAALIRALA
ncbi:MAG: hypothetical protein L0271_06710 [Gemmatimonadetes bacterium]|nr:hypothetical protein [Gemmatimonadota bacterium]